ncbi:MAG: TatD family hydrolase [Hydrogenoanaerobacterium sp.]
MYENIFDSHAHYDDKRFDDDRDELLERLFSQGLRGVINAASSIESSKTSLALAQKYTQIYCAAGVHPEETQSFSQTDCDILAELAQSPRVVAIGEIGLDYHYDDAAPREKQREAFESQLILAGKLNLPVIVHDRDAHGDTMDLLRRYRPRGVLHCFSGSAEMAREVLSLGMYLGFTGVVTFKNARKALAAAEATPINRILLETDCPYMAPEPNRGRRCDSGMLENTCEALAIIKNITPQQLFDATSENTKELFNIKA